MDVLPDLCISPSRTTTGKCNTIDFVWDSCLFPLSAMIFSPANPLTTGTEQQSQGAGWTHSIPLLLGVPLNKVLKAMSFIFRF